jgi:hypothetical protein
MEGLIAGLIWTKIDPSKIPEGEVLAANFDTGSIYFGERLIGKLFTPIFGNHIGVRDSLAPIEMKIEIPNITHYIEL